MHASTPASARSGNRSLLLIAAAVLALVVLTVAVVLVAGNRAPTQYPPDSPEAALQGYLAAFEADDVEAAHAYFSAPVRERMDLEAYERAIDEGHRMYPPDSSRSVLFDRRSGEGDSVRLHLTVEEFYGEGLNGTTNRSPREIRLVREDGAWRIDEPLVWLDPAPIFDGPAHP